MFTLCNCHIRARGGCAGGTVPEPGRLNGAAARGLSGPANVLLCPLRVFKGASAMHRLTVRTND